MSDPLVAITERLHHDFPTKTLAELMELVGRCLREIDTGVPDDCMQELVERLARTRLENDASQDASAPPGPSLTPRT